MKVQKALAALLCALLCLTGCVGQGEADGQSAVLAEQRAEGNGNRFCIGAGAYGRTV